MINLYKLKFTILQQEIVRYLMLSAGKQFNARRLALALKVSPPAIAKAIPALEKDGFIKIEKDKESGRFSIELNRDNPEVIGLKRAENIKMLYESGFVKFLQDAFPGTKIIIFGSYSYGTDNINSDIDVAIIGSKIKEINLEKFEKILEKKIVLHFYYTIKEIHKNLMNNIINGIIIKGIIEI